MPPKVFFNPLRSVKEMDKMRLALLILVLVLAGTAGAATSVFHSCDDTSYMNAWGTMTLTVVSEGPSGISLKADSTSNYATQSWLVQSQNGGDVTIGTGATLELDYKGGGPDFQIDAWYGAISFTVKPWHAPPAEWTQLRVDLPAGNLTHIDFSCYAMLGGPQGNVVNTHYMDNLKIYIPSKGDIVEDYWFIDFKDLAKLAQNWLDCTRPDCE
jgi:hypothetical protein